MNLLKKLCVTAIFFTGISLSSSGQIALTIEINGLRNNWGQVLVELSDAKNVGVKGVSHTIRNNQCVIVIEGLNRGKYGLKYFHDENNNSKFDMNWIGIPLEGYGFSNNAKGIFRPPAYEKTLFELKHSMTIKCYISYILN
ncbi:MAG: DUF2141 domain-containing protein [Paludibacter sp.]|nr:DUF2141 domain-containing protein [Paludibacter sp.]